MRSGFGMQFIIEFILWGLPCGIGAMIKKLFRSPLSKTGVSEMWIGAVFSVAVLAIVIWVLGKVT